MYFLKVRGSCLNFESIGQYILDLLSASPKKCRLSPTIKRNASLRVGALPLQLWFVLRNGFYPRTDQKLLEHKYEFRTVWPFPWAASITECAMKVAVGLGNILIENALFLMI
ncbi:hypothetical protein DXN04_32160 [Chitinophaga silvisoli]|uniref:Uncharacterized protein n=1 Tax=Chitinophaga silvisoli TaxID=2291814 RepID=A0A3E1NS48_9BACT|nr:hypothetical protein DXN04_32160 [Chitinophaga silvisoli]